LLSAIIAVVKHFLCALSALVPLLAQPPASQPAKLQALIITGQNGHDWRATTPVLRALLEATGRFEVRVTEEFRGGAAESLAPYDVVLLNYYEKKKADLRWGERAETALTNYVRGGKGLVIYHFSMAAFEGWTEYEKMCAANWRPNNGHHSARHDYTVDIKDSDHPITHGMKAQFAKANDELYANLKWQPEGAHHMLATAWDDHALYKGKSNQPIPGAGIHQPMLWTVEYGKGRVFVTALGHDPAAMNSAGFIATLVRGSEWAATGNVTIPLPAEVTK
jgi:type 1 glutamine amidotransferase